MIHLDSACFRSQINGCTVPIWWTEMVDKNDVGDARGQVCVDRN